MKSMMRHPTKVEKKQGFHPTVVCIVQVSHERGRLCLRQQSCKGLFFNK